MFAGHTNKATSLHTRYYGKRAGKNSIIKRYRLHRMFDEPVALLLFRGEDDKL